MANPKLWFKKNQSNEIVFSHDLSHYSTYSVCVNAITRVATIHQAFYLALIKFDIRSFNLQILAAMTYSIDKLAVE